MGDRTSAEIELCGTIASKDIFETLVNLIESEGLGEEYGEACAPDEIRTALMEAASDGRRAIFRREEINYGEFNRIEAFCREAGLSYVRRSGAGIQYDAESVAWSPGMVFPAKTLVSAGGDPLLSRSALGIIEKQPPEEAMAALSKTLAELDRACGKDLPAALVIEKGLLAMLEGASPDERPRPNP